jgi:MoaA/NifB/PqqE/SkfB family radical SAM enzyme
MTSLNYNIVSHHKIDANNSDKLCTRAKLDTGTHCNYDCEFCYYGEQLLIRTDTDVIKKRIDYLSDTGMEEIDFSGGESSIHKDFFELIKYAKDKGFSNISTLSNGHKFSKIDFMRKAYDAGLTEILFSVHGSNANIHDKIVRRSGAFNRIIKAINLCREVGIKVRINTTVTMENFTTLSEFSTLIQSLDASVFEVNYLPLNHWDDAKSQIPLDYMAVCTEIKKSIDILKSKVSIINVRYTPYCYMEGYEQYVCSTYQHIWDVYDWNIGVYDYSVDPQVYKKDPLKHLLLVAKENRNRTYMKPKSCMNCKYFFICDGIEIENNSVLPNAIEGEVMYNPIHYRKGYYESI